MPIRYSILAGKTVQRVARMRGGGSALPGLIVERVDPKFMQRTLDQLPYGVVLISGTNGKTTTTKMVVELLRSQGLRVFTNRSGSNFTRGVTASLLSEVDRRGKIDADIAVLELDEAHAVHFVRQVPPRYSLFLNVMRDQLDRFGEIDATAELLRTIAEKTTAGIVINHDDPRLSSPKFLNGLEAEDVRSFSVAPSLLDKFPSDDRMRQNDNLPELNLPPKRDDTSLISVNNNQAAMRFADKTYQVSLKLKGIYNIQNAAAALAFTRMIMGDKLNTEIMLQALARVEPAFGRGESIEINGRPIELVLVKNPSGFRLSLSSFDPKGVAVMIAINDNYADGRDMSWLWDVEFDSLKNQGVQTLTGVRAYDMALRLQYDEVTIGSVQPNIQKALRNFLEISPDKPGRIYCTYTAMLALRRELGKLTKVEQIQ